MCSESVRISVRKVFSDAGVIAVRRRLMKAVFFLRDESRELLAVKTSVLL